MSFVKRYNINAQIVITSVFLMIVPYFLQNDFYYEIAILSMLNAVICIGLNLLIGYAGQISLGHGAFAGLGAYISAILATNYEINPILSIFFSTILMMVFAFIISKPILRLKGHYLAMATLGVGIIIQIVLNNESDITGGPDGMAVDSLRLFGYEMSSSIEWYIFCAIFLVLTIWGVENLIKSPLGRILRSIHDSEKAASSIGANVIKYKSLVFVISVVVATIAGSLYAFYSGFISPSEASFNHSIELVVMVVFGGLGRIYGAVIGAVLLTIIPQLLTTFEDYETLIFGSIIIFVMLFLPKGIVSIWDRFLKLIRRGVA
jgi:branched-chain amino acid transport system permease protein